MKPIIHFFILLSMFMPTECRDKNEDIFNKVVVFKADSLVADNNVLQSFHKLAGDSVYSIYLTFDDGPAEGSENINKIAAADSVSVNICIAGRKVGKTDQTQYMFQLYKSNPFVEIYNHSYSHANDHYKLYYQAPGQVVANIKLNEDTLPIKNKIVRLPGRNTWRIHGKERNGLVDDKEAADSLASQGYSIIGWDVEWNFLPDSSFTIEPSGILI